MKSSFRTVIDHPADRIDLAQWLSTMSDRDYQVCSRGHRAAGTFPEGGTFGMVNVESIGGHLLIQHYLAEHVPSNSSVLRTSIMPPILKAGFPSNVIPSEGEAMLDIRALPDKDMTKLYSEMRRVIRRPSD